MVAIFNSTCKTFSSVEDRAIRKTQSYLGYYESLELRKEIETRKKGTINQAVDNTSMWKRKENEKRE